MSNVVYLRRSKPSGGARSYGPLAGISIVALVVISLAQLITPFHLRPVVIVAEDAAGACLGAYPSLTSAQRHSPTAALYRPIFPEQP